MPRILVVAPNWVGDAVLAEPLLARLAAREPGVAIDVLAPGWTLPVFHRMAAVSDTLPLPFGHGQLNWRAVRECAAGLRGRYCQAVVLPNSLKSALIPWLAHIPVRTGFRGEWRYGLLNDLRTLDAAALPLMVERFAQLAVPRGEALPRPVAEPRLQVNAADQKATLDRLGIPRDRPLVALCPGAEYGPAKQWPARHFAEAARQLAGEGYTLVLMGSAKDSAIAAEINTLAEGVAIDLTGRTSLAEAIDLLGAAAHVITNDSGLMHIAAALDRPTVAIFGSSSPRFTPPLSRRAQVIRIEISCSPCFERVCPLGHMKCLNDLTPERVLAAVHESP